TLSSSISTGSSGRRHPSRSRRRRRFPRTRRKKRKSNENPSARTFLHAMPAGEWLIVRTRKRRLLPSAVLLLPSVFLFHRLAESATGPGPGGNPGQRNEASDGPAQRLAEHRRRVDRQGRLGE